MIKKANSADVRCLTRATAKAQRKRRSLLKGLYSQPYWPGEPLTILFTAREVSTNDSLMKKANEPFYIHR